MREDIMCSHSHNGIMPSIYKVVSISNGQTLTSATRYEQVGCVSSAVLLGT